MKLTLDDLANLQNENTAVGKINSNNTLIENAIEKTLSRDGTSPNNMEVALDMDSNRILNLPSPITNTEPVRLVDLLDYDGGGLVISPLPTGGATGELLLKNSGTDYDTVWSSAPTLTTPVLGTPVSGTLTNCTGLPISTGVSGLGTGVATFLATPTSANLIAAVTDETGTGSLVFSTSPTLVTPILGTPTSGTLTNCTGLPISTGVSGLGTSVATFLATPSSANLRAALTDETGTGAAVFATSPTITTPDIVGTVAVNNAAAGSVGEIISNSVTGASFTSGAPQNLMAIGLTPGDWDIYLWVIFQGAGATVTTRNYAGISTTSGTLPPTSTAFAYYELRITGTTDLTNTVTLGPVRASISSNTTYYAVGRADFTTSTFGANASIRARRIR